MGDASILAALLQPWPLSQPDLHATHCQCGDFYINDSTRNNLPCTLEKDLAFVVSSRGSIKDESECKTSELYQQQKHASLQLCVEGAFFLKCDLLTTEQTGKLTHSLIKVNQESDFCALRPPRD